MDEGNLGTALTRDAKVSLGLWAHIASETRGGRYCYRYDQSLLKKEQQVQVNRGRFVALNLDCLHFGVGRWMEQGNNTLRYKRSKW